MKQNSVLKLTEASVMIALATVLGLLRLAELPYGGSVTFASMLPIVLIAYRWGARWGVPAGLLFGVIQQLLGLKNLSYVSGWVSVVAVVVLDYLLAYAAIGFAGVFRGKLGNQPTELIAGVIFGGMLRYFCHVVSGATVWAGLSIPTEAALVYSFGYNLTYMLPEILIVALVGAYVGAMIDFRVTPPARMQKERSTLPIVTLLYAVAGGALLIGLTYLTVNVFVAAQSAESGLFDFVGVKELAWGKMAGFVGATALTAAVALAVAVRLNRKAK